MTLLRFPHMDPPAEGTATPVATGVLWMRLPLPMALDHVNVYALDDGDGWTLVDTGIASDRGVALWQRLLAGPLAGKPVNRVIVTHHHPDHVGMAGWFQARGADLSMTRTAWLYARMLVLDEQALPTREQIAFWRGAGMDAGLLAQRSMARPYNFCDAVAPMPPGFTRIAEGDEITAGGRNWVVRLGSGHAPDHATLWSGDGTLVLGGDQLLPNISANIGVYPTEPGADPLQDWLSSTARLATFATDDQLVLPGHKLPFRGLPFRLKQMVVNHENALARLRAHLVVPSTAVECFLPLFRRDITGPEYGLALAEALAHLNYLLRRGEVVRSLRQDGAWMWQLHSEGES